jgi:hypothetical protein
LPTKTETAPKFKNDNENSKFSRMIFYEQVKIGKEIYQNQEKHFFDYLDAKNFR